MSDVQTPGSNDWLTRLSNEEWMQVATKELRECLEALRGKHHRKGVAAGRRAAGMALNAVLLKYPNPAWGRSYVDHLKAIASQDDVPEVVRESARELLDAPHEGPRLIRLGPGDESLAAAAATVIDWSHARLTGDA